MIKEVAICIPAYEMGGKAKEYLPQLLNTISAQRGINYRVFVSDSSTDNDDVKQVCDRYKFVTRIENTSQKKIAADNINNALLNSDGDVIKIMFADDFFVDDYALFDCTKPIFDGHFWSCTACCHSDDGKTLYRPFYPRYHDDIHLGNNTMSSPTVITMRRDNDILFDENIHYLVDVEWYKRMSLKHGPPHINNRINVVNRIHDNSLTSQLSKQNLDTVRENELKYVINKMKEINNEQH